MPKTIISYLSSVYCSNGVPTVPFQTFISTFDEGSIPSLDIGTDTCTSDILGTSTAISNYFTPTGNAVSWLETHLQTGTASQPKQTVTSRAAAVSALNSSSSSTTGPSATHTANTGAAFSTELGMTAAAAAAGVLMLMLRL